MHNPDLRAPLPPSEALDQLLDEAHDTVVADRIAQETAAVRAAEPRVDAKATTLLAWTSAMLVAGLGLLTAGQPHGAAAGYGWSAVGLLAAGVLTLKAAVLPRLGGGFGFVRWATIRDPRDLVDALLAEPVPGSSADHAEKARQLAWCSRQLRRKFRLIQAAQTLLVVALASGVAAAVTTTWAR
jgi:hypothetical protein